MAAATVGRHKARVREDAGKAYEEEVMIHELSEQEKRAWEEYERQAWEEYERQAWEEYERRALAEYRRKQAMEENAKEEGIGEGTRRK